MMPSEFPDGYVHDYADDTIAAMRGDIPDHLLAGLDDYVRDRMEVGHFLTALLTNDLRGAYERGDAVSVAALPALVLYCNSCLPAPAWGSPEKVKAWLGDA